MERYNHRSGFLVTPTVHDSGRTERDHLTDKRCSNALRWRERPKFNGINRNFTLLQILWEREKPTRPKKPVSWLNRPESGAKLRCVISSLQHLEKHCLYCSRAQYPPSQMRVWKPEMNMDSPRSYTHLMSLHLWKRRTLLRMFQHLPLNKAKLFISTLISVFTTITHPNNKHTNPVPFTGAQPRGYRLTTFGVTRGRTDHSCFVYHAVAVRAQKHGAAFHIWGR